MEKTVVCVKWGSLYDADYVNNLYAMVRRNLTPPFRFICFTDNTTNIHPNIETKSLPAHLKGWWGKTYYFKNPLEDITGPVLAIDLDTVIVDNIDCMFAYEPNEFIMRFDYPGYGHNSSVMRFEANQYGHIYDRLNLSKIEHSIDNSNRRTFKQKKYWGDQIWITEQMNRDPLGRTAKLWPKAWIPKYSIDCHRERDSKKVYADIQRRARKAGEFFIPNDARIIMFAGYSNNNKRHINTIKQWWHADDL